MFFWVLDTSVVTLRCILDFFWVCVSIQIKKKTDTFAKLTVTWNELKKSGTNLEWENVSARSSQDRSDIYVMYFDLGPKEARTLQYIRCYIYVVFECHVVSFVSDAQRSTANDECVTTIANFPSLRKKTTTTKTITNQARPVKKKKEKK